MGQRLGAGWAGAVVTLEMGLPDAGGTELAVGHGLPGVEGWGSLSREGSTLSEGCPLLSRGWFSLSEASPHLESWLPNFRRGVPNFWRGAPKTRRGAPNFARGAPNFWRVRPKTRRGAQNFARGRPNSRRVRPKTWRGRQKTWRGRPNLARGSHHFPQPSPRKKQRGSCDFGRRHFCAPGNHPPCRGLAAQVRGRSLNTLPRATVCLLRENLAGFAYSQTLFARLSRGGRGRGGLDALCRAVVV